MASEDIVTLRFPESLHLAPGMYIGSLEDASNIFREIIDNAIDEMYRYKSCDTVDIRVSKNHEYTISDNGRGFPIKESKLIKGQTMAQEATSNINSGSKFENKIVSLGTHGSGAKCAVALSDYFELYTKMSLQNLKEIPKRLQDIYKGEKYYKLRYELGYVKEEGFCDLDSDFSTIIKFKPSLKFFESDEAYMPVELKYIDYILKHKFNKEMKVFLNGKRYVTDIDELHTSFDLGDGKFDLLASVSIKDKFENGELDASVNGLYCPKGLHVRWFTRAFVKAFNQLFGRDYSVEDVFFGLSARVILLFPNQITFTSQLKETLGSLKGYPTKGDAIIDTLVEPIYKILRKERSYWAQHDARLQSLLEVKEKINTKELVKETFDVDNKKRKKLPSKLMDCTTKNRKEAELLICEGSSAQSSLVQARDSKIHAVLALRGKMLNTVGRSVEEIVENQEVRDIINAIGIGTKDYCKPRNLRYGKICIVTDADSDASQISSLILGLLYTHIPKLFELGVVYRVIQPLFKVGDQYVYTDTLKGVNTKGKHVERYKGLGSVDPAQMKDIALNPKTRRLQKITMEDAIYATQIMTSPAIKAKILIKNGVIDL